MAGPLESRSRTISASTEFAGARGRIHLHRWSAPQPAFAVVLAHGYGEHAGRFDHVAQALVGAGAAVIAPDHLGHGRSEGERALINDYAPVVDDLSAVAAMAEEEHPGLPLVLIGHSLGGLIGTTLVQRDPSRFAAVVLSAPFFGNPDVEGMLGLDPLPEVPIDPAVLSRDPAVGEAYLADELVYHGPFKRATLEATFAAVRAVEAGPSFGATPVVWVHGDEDGLAPLAVTRGVLETVKGDVLEEHVYPGARHEVFNETNQDEVIGDVVAFLQKTL